MSMVEGRSSPRHRVSKNARYILETGLRERWYGICPATHVSDRPKAITRWGRKLVLWRDSMGCYHLHEDRCPHRGAPLSLARNDGDRLTCAYHGVAIFSDGSVAEVPGQPGSELVGCSAVRTYPVNLSNGVIFAWLSDEPEKTPAPFQLPQPLSSDKYSAFLSYAEWRCPYLFIIDNNMDPMHGVFLHQLSHSMAEGSRQSEFSIRNTKTGFVFEKKDQKGINFDWSEWYDDDFQAVCLEIPYPASGGPGGSFGIVFHVTPIDEKSCACFFWRNRKVTGWERDTWRFLYRNRLEGRHWHVLEQDRLVAESMADDADCAEYLYSHDVGVSRVRKIMSEEAERQAKMLERN